MTSVFISKLLDLNCDLNKGFDRSEANRSSGTSSVLSLLASGPVVSVIGKMDNRG